MSSFAFTRQSSSLLEKIGMSINHQEPVLLVGETGTGKTSIVQYLAQQTGEFIILHSEGHLLLVILRLFIYRPHIESD